MSQTAFVFFVLFVVNIYCRFLEIFSTTKDTEITKDYLCTFFIDGAAA